MEASTSALLNRRSLIRSGTRSAKLRERLNIIQSFGGSSISGML